MRVRLTPICSLVLSQPIPVQSHKGKQIIDKRFHFDKHLDSRWFAEKLKLPQYVYQAFFGNTFLSRTDTIIFDEVSEDYRQVARFVMLTW